MDKNINSEKYIRQISLKEIGKSGQDLIRSASVLVVGAGGLGCPALQYLAGAGTGKIGVVDFDKIELSNLHRQLLFTEKEIGNYKAETAKNKLKEISPESEIVAFNMELNSKNAIHIFEKYDVVLDCTDQIPVRYAINDAARILNKTWIYGSINAFEGQWAVMNFNGGPDYRDLFPIPPNPMTVLNCETAGTLGMIPGFVGVMQAFEVIKLICKIPFETGILNHYNGMSMEMYKIKINRGERVPISVAGFENTDYVSMALAAHFEKQVK